MIRRMLALGILAVLVPNSAPAQSTELMSSNPAGRSGFGWSDDPTISDDGRFVAFSSNADDLVSGDVTGVYDVFVRDRLTGTTELVSVDSAGMQGNADSYSSAISGDGRYVAFRSWATNLVPGDTNQSSDIFVRDRLTSTTERVSLDSIGGQSVEARRPTISSDGRYVVFVTEDLLTSDAPAGPTNVYLRDRVGGTTLCMTAVAGSPDPYGPYGNPIGFVSNDDRYVVFESSISNLVPDDTDGNPDVFIRDLQSGAVERVSRSATRGGGSYLYGSRSPVSADGRYVVFTSQIPSYVPDDLNGWEDVFVLDRTKGAYERASVSTNGVEGNFNSTAGSITPDGRFVVFQTEASNLVTPDANSLIDDVLVRDRLAGITERAGVDSAGGQAADRCERPTIAGNGRYVAFATDSSLEQDDWNTGYDVYLRDRFGDPIPAHVCEPGIAGVLACPCSNPPAGSGRGCDNSNATGGASLETYGRARLHIDTLTLSVTGEPSGAASLVLQGRDVILTGRVYGQGLLCVRLEFKRLYSRVAVGGSFEVPNFTAGDRSITARSAALGDLIQAGQARFYAVAYRDSVVLGGCPATSTFNVTQTARVNWFP